MSLTEALVTCCCQPLNQCEIWNLVCGRPGKITVDITHTWSTTVSGTLFGRYVREDLESGVCTMSIPFMKFVDGPYGASTGYLAFVGDPEKKAKLTVSQSRRGWAYNCDPVPILVPQCGSTCQGTIQADIAPSGPFGPLSSVVSGNPLMVARAVCGAGGIRFSWSAQSGGTGNMGHSGTATCSEFATQFCSPRRVAQWSASMSRLTAFQGSIAYGHVGSAATRPECVPLPYRRCPKWSEILANDPPGSMQDRYGVGMNIGWGLAAAPNHPPVQNQANGCIQMIDEWTGGPVTFVTCQPVGWAAGYFATGWQPATLASQRHFISPSRVDMGDGQYRQESRNDFIYYGFGGNGNPNISLNCRTDSRWRVLIY